MISQETEFDTLRRYGDLLIGSVLARDHLQLQPRLISKAAARRLRSGIRMMEGWVRRLIILMALALEAGLSPRSVERPVRPSGSGQDGPGAARVMPHRLRMFPREAMDDLSELSDPVSGSPSADWEVTGEGQVVARPLLVRLGMLKRLMAEPEARARRLAWHLARCRPGVILPPVSVTGVPGRYGVEASALFDMMGHAILSESRARPPPLGPVPRPPPGVRVL